ncbi:hypothetical protein GGX14DRAFT_580072 [Mycena pura]|uniref:Uncharacterized protein n=1 Tax=Mycena pura TaxID=153505 RepID=A0AAD6ULS1_9AGAR|nr:hypothetical protein GGX14DRAFT_580072 [Mycena pura]
MLGVIGTAGVGALNHARFPSRARMCADYRAKKYEFDDVPDIFPQEAMLRQFIAWLNSESLELGGPFVEPLPIERGPRSLRILGDLNDWFDHDNYTRFDRLSASEWPKPGPPFR